VTGKYKDIVEEVFSKSKKADDRVSALFTRFKHPPQVSLEKGQMCPSDLKESPAAKDISSSGNKRTIKNKKLLHQVRTVVVAGLVAVVFVLAFLVGSYLGQLRKDY